MVAAERLRRVVLALAAALMIAQVLVIHAPRVLARARYELPLLWSEEPLWAMAGYFRQTGDLYGPVEDMRGYVYGPLLGLLLSTGHALGMTSLPQMRAISMATALLGAAGLLLITRALLAPVATTRPQLRTWFWPVVVAVLGTCHFSLNITFETLHPDNLSWGLVSLALGLLLSAREEGAATWRRLTGAGVCFGLAFACKQTTGLISFVAIVGHAFTHDRRYHRAAVLVAAAAVPSLIALGIAGLNGWTWAFWIPSHHPYELNMQRVTGLINQITQPRPYLALLLVGTLGLALMSLVQRADGRLRRVYAAVVLAACLAAGIAYFKARGVWNNFYLPIALAFPLFVVDAIRGVSSARRVLAGFVLCSLPFVTATTTHQEPDADVQAGLGATYEMARAICAEGKPFTVLWPIYPFRDCPWARPMLYESYKELSTGALMNSEDLTKLVLDRGDPVLTLSLWRLPQLLRSGFTEERLTLAYQGWGHRFIPYYLVLFRPPTASDEESLGQAARSTP